MANISIETDGKEVIQALDDLLNGGLQEILSEALTDACLIIEADAKRKCPVGDGGQLRQSISSQVDSDQLEGAVGSSVEYAPYVEIGTGIYSSKGDGRKTPWTYYDEKKGKWFTTEGQHPKPYLRPAMESNKGKIIKCFEGLI